MGHDHAIGMTIVFVDHDNIRELVLNGSAHDLFHRAVLAPHGLGIWNDAREFLHKGNGALEGKELEAQDDTRILFKHF